MNWGSGRSANAPAHSTNDETNRGESSIESSIQVGTTEAPQADPVYTDGLT